VKKQRKTVLSSDGVHRLYGVVYLPDTKPRAYVQILHGMTEFTERYEEFLSRLAQEGFIAFGFDSLGHGETGKAQGAFGFFAEKKGSELLQKDVALCFEEIRREFGDLPYCLFGHSMGSLIARSAVAEGRVSPDKLVLMATGGKNRLAAAGIFLADLICAVKGAKYVSDFLQKLVFHSYDDRFPGDYPNRWVSVDVENLKKYANHPFCTFRFTASAMGDLIHLHKKANSASFYRKAVMPTLLLSGEEDPVGDYGKGVRSVERALSRAHKKATLRLYPGYRHEILNDFCKEEVVDDILSFLNQ